MKKLISGVVNNYATKVAILGAAGRDFHDFNMYFRENEDFDVCFFTATQIMGIEDRIYPPSLSGDLYPEGIPIFEEVDLESLIEEYGVEECCLSYSDLSHTYVMNLASRCMATGVDFKLLGPDSMMLDSDKFVISVCGTRTGVGKSQTSRKLCDGLNKAGIKAVALRHPMPYGDLAAQAYQRYEVYDDLIKHDCSIEEMEEYEPYIERGMVIFAGVDYERILREAEKECDVIIWDGGNNDVPFVKPDVSLVIADPHRPGHELFYHPGEINFRMADYLILNKIDTAPEGGVEIILENAKKVNPEAPIILAESPCTVENPEEIRGKKVLIVEDGPTLTHGDMHIGAGYVAIQDLGCEIVDPRPYAIGTIKDTFDHFTQLEYVLPAMGYGEEQMKELETTINSVDCDVVIVGTPIDLGRYLDINKPAYRVVYELDEKEGPTIDEIIEKDVVPNL